MNSYKIDPKRLLKAIWFLGTAIGMVFLCIWVNEHSNLQDYIKNLKWGDNDDSYSEYELLFVPAGLYLMYALIKGTNYFMTLNLDSGPGDGDIWGHFGNDYESYNSEYPGVVKALNYRNTQLSNSTNIDAQNTFKNTAWVDGLLQNSKGNPGLSKTIRFLDTQFSNMTNQDSLNYMMNKK